MHQLTRRIMNDHALPSPSTQLKKKKTLASCNIKAVQKLRSCYPYFWSFAASSLRYV